MRDARKILKELKDLEKRRQEILTGLLATDELALGTLFCGKRPCGNPRCKQCQEEGASHEQVIFHYTNEEGRRTSRFVRRMEEDRFKRASDRYKAFRAALRELKHVESEFHRMCGAFMRARALDPISRD